MLYFVNIKSLDQIYTYQIGVHVGITNIELLVKMNMLFHFYTDLEAQRLPLIKML